MWFVTVSNGVRFRFLWLVLLHEKVQQDCGVRPVHQHQPTNGLNKQRFPSHADYNLSKKNAVYRVYCNRIAPPVIKTISTHEFVSCN